jgi:hypothetical protein
MWQALLRRKMRAMAQHALPDDLIELIARRFGVLADPTRIKLLDLLREQEASVHPMRPSTHSAKTSAPASRSNSSPSASSSSARACEH